MTPNPIKNLVASIVRTVVPTAVGATVTWLARKWSIVIDDSTQAAAITYLVAAASGVYYVVVRVFETYVTPRFSWFLGDFRKGRTEPIYADATETIVVPPATGAPEA